MRQLQAAVRASGLAIGQLALFLCFAISASLWGGGSAQNATRYPVNMTVPGMPELGTVSVLGEFEMGLPMDGVGGLSLGYTLEIKAKRLQPGSSTYLGDARETALQAALGLKLALPYGAWPANAADPPKLYVVDPAAGFTTQFACFTCTKVQILTQKEPLQRQA